MTLAIFSCDCAFPWVQTIYTIKLSTNCGICKIDIHTKIDFEGYLKSLPNQMPLQQLIVNLDAIDELVEIESREPSLIEVNHIDRKIRYCKNSSLLRRRRLVYRLLCLKYFGCFVFNELQIHFIKFSLSFLFYSKVLKIDVYGILFS